MATRKTSVSAPSRPDTRSILRAGRTGSVRQSRHRMRAFLVRRVAFALVLVACASSTAFLLTRAAPGDVTTQLGPFAKADEIAATRARFGLDQPFIVQWAR